MNSLELFVRSPVAEAIGWTLLHSLWQGVLAAVLLSFTLAATHSAKRRYAAGVSLLALLLTSSALTLAWHWPSAGQYPHAIPQYSATHGGQLPANFGARLDWTAFVSWLAPIWFCGACLFNTRYLAGWIWLQRLRRRGLCEAPEAWQRAVDRLRLEMGLSRAVRLFESGWAEVPMVLGHLRPVILVPFGFLSGLPPDHVEAILLHELAHVLRSDYLMNMLQRVVEGLFFYHPAVWWISGIIRRERENCCDDHVLGWRGDAWGYAAALSDLESSRLRQWPAQESAMAAKGSDLMNRIQRLLFPPLPARTWAPLAAAVILIASTGTGFAAWHMSPQAGVSASHGDAWQKWLNEDVVYIISAQERAAFGGLRTDDEREHFVEQFWERRNPKAGAAPNEFKQEHYRRIVFANKHFGSSTQGWVTDRGRIYIVYGPPDEIDSHLAHGGNSLATEEWLYHHSSPGNKDGVFFFIDRDGTGDYRLAPAPQ